MRKNRWKQWMAGFLALAMLVTETPIVHAEEGVVETSTEQSVEEQEQQEGTADELYGAQTVEEGSFTAVFGEEGTKYFKFVPTKTGTYHIFSVGDNDTYGYFIDGSSTEENDDGGDAANFWFDEELEAGKEYYIGVRFYSPASGTIPVMIVGTHTYVGYEVITDSSVTSVKAGTGNFYPQGMTIRLTADDGFTLDVTCDSALWVNNERMIWISDEENKYLDFGDYTYTGAAIRHSKVFGVDVEVPFTITPIEEGVAEQEYIIGTEEDFDFYYHFSERTMVTFSFTNVIQYSVECYTKSGDYYGNAEYYNGVMSLEEGDYHFKVRVHGKANVEEDASFTFSTVIPTQHEFDGTVGESYTLSAGVITSINYPINITGMYKAYYDGANARISAYAVNDCDPGLRTYSDWNFFAVNDSYQLIIDTTQESEEHTITLMLPEYQTIEEGTNSVAVIDEQFVFIKFIPEESGGYALYADSEYATFGYYFESASSLGTAKHREIRDFHYVQNLTAGEEYYCAAKYVSCSSETMDVVIEKQSGVVSATLGNSYEHRYLLNKGGEYQPVGLTCELVYADGTTRQVTYGTPEWEELESDVFYAYDHGEKMWIPLNEAYPGDYYRCFSLDGYLLSVAFVATNVYHFQGVVGERYEVKGSSLTTVNYNIPAGYYRLIDTNDMGTSVLNGNGEVLGYEESGWYYLEAGEYVLRCNREFEGGGTVIGLAEAASVGEGNFDAVIGEEAYVEYYKFVPEISGKYAIYSNADADTYGHFRDANGSQCSDDDSGFAANFQFVKELEAGEIYYIGVQYFSNTKNVTIPVVIEKATGIAYVEKKEKPYNQKYNLYTGGEYEPTGLTFDIFLDDGSSYTVVYGTPEWDELESDVYYRDDFGNNVSFNDIGEGVYWRNFSIGQFSYAISFEVFFAKEVNAKADAVYFVEENTTTIFKYEIPVGYYRISNQNMLNWTLTRDDNQIAAVDERNWMYLTAGNYELTVDQQDSYSGEIGLLAAKPVEAGDMLVVIDWEVNTECYRFTPTTTATYAIYSNNSSDTFGFLADEDGHYEDDDDSGEGTNFRFVRELEAGKEYYIGVRFLNIDSFGTINLVIEEYHEYVDYEIVTEPTVTTVEVGADEYRPEGMVIDLIASDGYRKTLTYGTEEWNKYESSVSFTNEEHNYIYFPIYGWTGAATRNSTMCGFEMEIPFTVVPVPEGAPEQEYTIENGNTLRFSYRLEEYSQISFHLDNARSYDVEYINANGVTNNVIAPKVLLQAGEYIFAVKVYSKENEEEDVTFSFDIIVPETKEFYGSKGETYTIEPNTVTTIIYPGLKTEFHKVVYDGDSDDVKFITPSTVDKGNSWALAGIWNDSRVVINTIGDTYEHQITVVAPEYQLIEEGHHTIQHTDRMEFLKFVPETSHYYDFISDNNELMTAYIYQQSSEEWEIEFVESDPINHRMWLNAGEEYCIGIYYNSNLVSPIDIVLERVTGVISRSLRDEAYNKYYFLNSTEGYRPTGLAIELVYGDNTRKRVDYGTPEWEELESNVYYSDSNGAIVDFAEIQEGYYYRYFDINYQTECIGFTVVNQDTVQGTLGTFYDVDAHSLGFITYELTPGYYQVNSDEYRDEMLVAVSDGKVTKQETVWKVETAGTYMLQVENYYYDDTATVALETVPTVNIGSQNVEANGYVFTYKAFTPEKTGIYHIYSVADGDIIGRLIDGDLSWISDCYYDENGYNDNFRFDYKMVAGQTYLIGAQFNGVENGTFTLIIEKEIGIEEYRLPSENYVYIIGERSMSYDPQGMPLTLLYEDGTEKTILYDDGDWRNNESSVRFLNTAGEEVVLDWDTPCGTYERVSDIGGCEIRIPYEVVERQELAGGTHTITVPGNERAFFTYTVTRDGDFYFMANGTVGARACAYSRDVYIGRTEFNGGSALSGGCQPLKAGEIISIDYYPSNQPEEGIMDYDLYSEKVLESITLFSPEKDWKVLYRRSIDFPGLIVRLTYDDKSFEDIAYGTESWYRQLYLSNNIDLEHWDDESEDWVKGEDADEYGNALPGDYEFYVGFYDKTLTIPFTIVDSVEQLEAIFIDEEISVSEDAVDNIFQLVVEKPGWYELTRTVDSDWFGYGLYDISQNPIYSPTGYCYWLEAGSYMFVVCDNCADQQVAWKKPRAITTDSPIDVPGRYFDYFVYTFTPEQDAIYRFTTTGEWDPSIEIYVEGEFLNSDDNGGDDFNCDLQVALQKGITYLVHVLSSYGDNDGEHQLLVEQEPVYQPGDSIPTKHEQFTAVRVSIEEAGYYEIVAPDNTTLNYYVTNGKRVVEEGSYFLEPGEYDVSILTFYYGGQAQEEQCVVLKSLDRLGLGKTNVGVRKGQVKSLLFVPEETAFYSFYSENSVEEDTYGYLAGSDFYIDDDDSHGDYNFLLSRILEKGKEYVVACRFLSLDLNGDIKLNVEKQKLTERFEILEKPVNKNFAYPFATNWIDLDGLCVKKYYSDGSEETCYYGEDGWNQERPIIKIISSEGFDYGYATGRKLPAGTYNCEITLGFATQSFEFEVKEIEQELTLNEQIQIEDTESTTYYKFTVDDSDAIYRVYSSGTGMCRVFDQSGDEVNFYSRMETGEYYFAFTPYVRYEEVQYWFRIVKYDELADVEIFCTHMDMNRLFEWNSVEVNERYLRIRYTTKSGYTGEDGLLNFLQSELRSIYSCTLTLKDSEGNAYYTNQKLPLGIYTLKLAFDDSELESSLELEVKDNVDYPVIRKGEKYGLNTNPLGNRFAFKVPTDARLTFTANYWASFLIYDIEREQYYRFANEATLDLHAGDYIMKVVNYTEGNAIYFEQFAKLVEVKEVSGKATEIEYGTWGYSVTTVSGNTWYYNRTTAVTPNTILNTLATFFVSSNNVSAGATVSSNNSAVTASGNRLPNKNGSIYADGKLSTSVSGNSWSVSANNVSKFFSSLRPQIGFEWLFEAVDEYGESKSFSFNDAIWNVYGFVTKLFFNEDGTPAKTDANGYLAPGNYQIAVGNDDASAMIDVKVTLPENAIYVQGQPVDTTVYVGEEATFSIDVLGKNLKYQWQYQDLTNQRWQTATDEGADSSVLKVAVDKQTIDGRIYRCVVSNSVSASVISDEVMLRVKEKPLAISKQPEDVTAFDGDTVKFAVEAIGDDLTYQWQYSKDGIRWTSSTAASAKTATLSTTVKESFSGRIYRCVVTDGNGQTVASEAASLTVKAALKITGQPADVTVTDGETAKYTVTATGEGLTYQWQYSKDNGKTWTNNTVSSAKKATLSLTAKESFNGRIYHCIVTDASGKTITSEAASITVKAALGITRQPVDVTVTDGETATFTVEATGENLTYQWQYSKDGGTTFANNTAAASAKTAAFSFAAKESLDGRVYRCVVSNASGKVYSETVSLTVKAALGITKQPADVTVEDGETAKFAVEATGEGLTYQWQYSKDGGKVWTNNTVTSAKKATMTLTAKEAWSGRIYHCIVTDVNGRTITSEAASLTVKAAFGITKQPTDLTVKEGEMAEFTIEASGDNLTYQWQYSKDGGKTWANNTATATAKTTVFCFVTKATLNDRVYRCVVTRGDSQIFSDPVRLTVTAGTPEIIAQPIMVVAAVNEAVEFSVKATGDNLTYQWQLSKDDGETWTNNTVSSAKTATLKLTAKESLNGRVYRCIVSNESGQTISETASLFVVAAKPVITTQPVDVTAAAGKTARFSVIATGENLTYQWQYSKDGINWTNSTAASAKTATLSTTVKDTFNGRKYRCAIGNGIVEVYTNAVTLTVN